MYVKNLSGYSENATLHSIILYISAYQLSNYLPLLRFSSAPTLTVAIEQIPHHTLAWVSEPSAPGGHRLTYTGYMAEIVMYFAKAMNFT